MDCSSQMLQELKRIYPVLDIEALKLENTFSRFRDAS